MATGPGRCAVRPRGGASGSVAPNSIVGGNHSDTDRFERGADGDKRWTYPYRSCSCACTLVRGEEKPDLDRQQYPLQAARRALYDRDDDRQHAADSTEPAKRFITAATAAVANSHGAVGENYQRCSPEPE